MMGVDDLLADKDFDLADIAAALAKVRNGLGKRRPAPTYYEVDVTLEELYTGCTKEVTHVRVVGAAAVRKETVLVSASCSTAVLLTAPRPVVTHPLPSCAPLACVLACARDERDDVLFTCVHALLRP